MIKVNLLQRQTLGAAAIAVAVTLLAGCASGSGSSSSSTSTATAAAPASAAASSSAAATGDIATASGPLGAYLVDKSGKAIYILTSDKPGGASACTTACLKAWLPVAAPTPLPSAVAGVSATFGTASAADGSSELTVNGYPVYTFIKDTGPGTTAGQGIASFGGTWWLVTPTGSWITAAAASSSTSASKSATGYGY